VANPKARNADLPRSAAGPNSPWLIAVIVSIATFMEVLDTTIANVALRHIAGGLAASQDESTWILTSYLVSNAIVLPISGWLSNVIGRKRFYMSCVAIFTCASVMCGFATSLGFMVTCRIIQGIGGGGLATTEQSIFADSFSPAMRSMAFALYGLTVVVAPAIGPVLGGWLTDDYSWHWVFLINLPVGILSLTLTYFFVYEPKALKDDRRKLLAGGLSIDYVGFALVVLGFGSLQIVLDRYQRDDGFSSLFIAILAAICFVSLASLSVWETMHRHPIMNVRLLAIPSFAISCAVMFIIGFMLISTTQLLPQYSQELMGYDAITAGKTLALGGVLTVILMPVSGLVSGLVQPKWLLFGALGMTAFSLYHLTGLDPTASFWTLAEDRMLQVVALPFLFIPISAASYNGIPPDKTNEASAIINLMRNLGGSVGVSFTTTLLQQRDQFHHERLAEHVTRFSDMHGQTLARMGQAVETQASALSYIDVFYVLAIIALVVTPMVLFLHDVPKGARAGGH
jgi:MFS transporter, DHA2 family, multidrug resistance protein